MSDAPPGRYFARLRALTDDGITTPASPVLEFRVPAGVGAADGTFLESGSGGRVEAMQY